MDEDVALVSILALMMLTIASLFFVGLMPTWLVIHHKWASFSWWFKLSMSISRVVYIIMIPLYFLTIFIKGKVMSIIYSIEAAILGIWAIPVYTKAVLSLAYTDLSSLELQRTILIIILVYSLMAGLAYGSKSKGDEED